METDISGQVQGAREAAWAGHMRLIGLTGGIASGKSLVAGFLRELGAEVLDADAFAREAVQAGEPALREIVEAFGPEYLLPDGTLNRKALGARIFADAEARARLNAIVHPRVRQRMGQEIERLRAQGPPCRPVILDIPLLYETINEPRPFTIDGILVVYADEETQAARLMARDGLSREQALQRIGAQMPMEEKRRRADWVIDNSRTPEHTRAQVAQWWHSLLRSRSGG